MQVNGEVIMRDFMDRWFTNMNIQVWIRTLKREEIETLLKQQYENTVKMFETFLRAMQQSDLSAYLEFKKAFQQTYDINSKHILEMWDEYNKSKIEVV